MGCIQCITSTEISNLKIIVSEEALKLASLGTNCVFTSELISIIKNYILSTEVVGIVDIKITYNTLTLKSTVTPVILETHLVETVYPDLDTNIIITSKALNILKLSSLSNEVNLEIQNISEELIFSTNSIEVRLHTESNNNMVIRHSMLCNIREYILLISEDEEFIIDESGNFYIEISEN